MKKLFIVQALSVSIGGYSKGLLLRVGSDFFEQESGRALRPEVKFPYRRLPQEVTTWKTWKQAHPDTDIYTGDSSASL